MKHLESRPLERPFFSHGTFILMAIMGTGFAFGILRLLIGLGAVTNLDNSYPWGIWIAIDVACGVALAAGGFTTAALVDIFGKKEYHALLRPAVLTAWLGYLMVSIGLMFDLGRYWNIWRPMFNWQGNSVMFELAMCVMAYLMVLSMEMAPSVLEGIKGRISGNKWGADILGKIEKPVIMLHSWVKILLPILIIAGVVLSCMHQSSLGTLMVIAPTKLSALWHTTWLPLLFLLSAIMVGFPMVIIEALLSSKGLKRPSEIQILGPLASKIPWFIALYAIFKFADLALRRSSLDFLEHPGSTVSFAIEVIMGLLVPFILLSMKTIRRSSGWLFTSCFLVLFGVALNRINVFLVGYHPAFAEKVYYPSIGEIALTCGLIATIVFLYRFFVNYFPILPVMVENEPVGADLKTPEEESVSPKVAWVTRGAAVLFILSFIILYVGVHKKAITHSELTYGEVFAAKKAHPEVKKSSALTHLFRPDKYRNFYILNSPLFQAPEQKDAANEGKTAPSGRNTNYYEPVRFSHR
ncbi:MAG: Ni/Fe-hydrogenase cytochrome b subunit, partial [bacterium]|nr:Ni/Fe-hydrogenase cytochrome b subunit [bacterium]